SREPGHRESGPRARRVGRDRVARREPDRLVGRTPLLLRGGRAPRRVGIPRRQHRGRDDGLQGWRSPLSRARGGPARRRAELRPRPARRARPRGCGVARRAIGSRRVAEPAHGRKADGEPERRADDGGDGRGDRRSTREARLLSTRPGRAAGRRGDRSRPGRLPGRHGAHPRRGSARDGPVVAAMALSRRARALMVQATASHAGKTVLTAGLCRLLVRRGLRALPFKAQNMSLNASVTADGREIGWAQAMQAEAARVAPRVEMNPILLKPRADDRSQLVVLGRAAGDVSAREYYRRGASLWPAIRSSYEA